MKYMECQSQGSCPSGLSTHLPALPPFTLCLAVAKAAMRSVSGRYFTAVRVLFVCRFQKLQGRLVASPSVCFNFNIGHTMRGPRLAVVEAYAASNQACSSSKHPRMSSDPSLGTPKTSSV